MYKLEDYGKTVPSLYVRVYRINDYENSYWLCSLTVCEGVSFEGTDPKRDEQFLRVYRWLYIKTGNCSCSLTVCEGVSRTRAMCACALLFPHCM